MVHIRFGEIGEKKKKSETP